MASGFVFGTLTKNYENYGDGLDEDEIRPVIKGARWQHNEAFAGGISETDFTPTFHFTTCVDMMEGSELSWRERSASIANNRRKAP